MKDGHRYVVCGKCGRIWNIAKEQDTRYGYLCPERIYKRRMERRKKDGQAHHYAVGGNRGVGSPSGNRSGRNQATSAGQAGLEKPLLRSGADQGKRWCQ